MPGARIPELEKCICGCSLELGSKIIAVLFCVLSSIAFICSIITVIWNEHESSIDGSMAVNRQGRIAEFGFLAILSGFLITLSAMLFYGVIKHKASYILPWCILTTAFNGILLFLTLITFLALPEVFWTQLIILSAIVAIFYAVLVVYGHFRQLRRQKNNPTTFTNTE